MFFLWSPSHGYGRSYVFNGNALNAYKWREKGRTLVFNDINLLLGTLKVHLFMIFNVIIVFYFFKLKVISNLCGFPISPPFCILKIFIFFFIFYFFIDYLKIILYFWISCCILFLFKNKIYKLSNIKIIYINIYHFIYLIFNYTKLYML